tara:strand:+ start:3125 stop:3283 length:159 start_codon:yes stop_codon:yes gene_type:complete
MSEFESMSHEQKVDWWSSVVNAMLCGVRMEDEKSEIELNDFLNIVERKIFTD